MNKAASFDTIYGSNYNEELDSIAVVRNCMRKYLIMYFCRHNNVGAIQHGRGFYASIEMMLKTQKSVCDAPRVDRGTVYMICFSHFV